jgi:hypothetical protein
LGIFLLFFGGIVVAYGEAIWNAGLTMTYIILYKNQEKENLLEREDEELQEEEEDEGTEENDPAAEETDNSTESTGEEKDESNDGPDDPEKK